ncbi:MAG: serine/threonine-protein kinase [Nanoarchaeota archaeon]|nr:serine/threonine-protein kinase [Nanoarchaeota archaeon]
MNVNDLMNNFKPGVVVPDGEAIAERYVLDRMIKRGGYGVVFAGHKESDASQEYALKFYFESGAHGGEAEAGILARLQRHPGVVKVHGRFSGRTLNYLVMELAQSSLYDVIAARRKDHTDPVRFSAQEIIDIGKQLANTLQYAQETACLEFHGDINPKNVLLFPGRYLGNKQFDTVYKLSDFGLALSKERVAFLEKQHSITSHAKIRGTSGYISPEWRNPQVKKDGRVDIWSFGVLLQELLIGIPIEDQNDFKKRALTPADVGVVVPKPLEVLIYRCFAGERNDRPKNFSEVLQQLESITPAVLQYSTLTTLLQNPFSSVAKLQEVHRLFRQGEQQFTDKEKNSLLGLLKVAGGTFVKKADATCKRYSSEVPPSDQIQSWKLRPEALAYCHNVYELSAAFRLFFPELRAEPELKEIFEE